MPKAIEITPETLSIITAYNGFDVEDIKDELLEKTHFLLSDVQFPHGYADLAIVTKETFERLFKPTRMSTTEMNEVEYL